jgi:hypothetical protein
MRLNSYKKIRVTPMPLNNTGNNIALFKTWDKIKPNLQIIIDKMKYLKIDFDSIEAVTQQSCAVSE